MNIVHCIWSFNTGGAETMLIDIANEQAKEHNVTVVIVNDSWQTDLVNKLPPNVRVIFIGRKNGSRSLWPVVKLNWILLRIRPDVVHLHNATLPGIILPGVNRRVFLTVHALQVPLDRVRRGVKLIAISEAVKDDILGKGNYDVVTIPNGINEEVIDKREMRPILPDGKMKIVQVGRLDSSKKGQDILIDAIVVLREREEENIEVDFIGAGESEFALKQLAEEKNVADRIHFLGLRDREYIYGHLKDYDLMCHPSRYEGFGLTVAEGMAAMLPVLVSNDGGPYEIIKKGELGSAFETGDAEDCANRIEYIYKNYNEALERTPTACEHICSHYSVKRMVAEYIEAYNK
jgi:glycosyltransferase involved in cell wall biosynthesis